MTELEKWFDAVTLLTKETQLYAPGTIDFEKAREEFLKLVESTQTNGD